MTEWVNDQEKTKSVTSTLSFIKFHGLKHAVKISKQTVNK